MYKKKRLTLKKKYKKIRTKSSKKFKKSKSNKYNKKIMKGGNYNIDQINILKKILKAFKYTIQEQNLILNILNQSSQNFPFNQVLYQLGIEDPNIDFNNLTDEEIEEGRNDLDRVLEANNSFLNNYEGETDEEQKTNSEE